MSLCSGKPRRRRRAWLISSARPRCSGSRRAAAAVLLVESKPEQALRARLAARPRGRRCRRPPTARGAARPPCSRKVRDGVAEGLVLLRRRSTAGRCITPPTPCTWATSAAGSSAAGVTWRLVTPASRNAAMRSLTYDAGPTRLPASSHSAGTSAAASSLVAAEVEVLDLLGLLLVAVLAGEVVVEVLARARPCRRRRGRTSGGRSRAAPWSPSPSPIASMPPAAISSGPRPPGALGPALASASPQTCSAFSGKKRIGSQPSAILRGRLDALRRRAPRSRSGTSARSGLVSSLSGLPSPVPWSGGQRQREDAVVVSVSRRRPRRTRSTISRVRPSGLS